jgi:hypothetical protein
MVTDAWEDVKAHFARILGRGKATEIATARVQLEQSRLALKSLTGSDLERARLNQEAIWRKYLADLLEQHPDSEAELRTLVAEVQARVAGLSAPVEQHVTAFDQAQQAVQGHGVQNVTFGGQHEPGASRR